MFTTQAIDFYVDDQNCAIPASIAQSYIGVGEVFLAEVTTVKSYYSPHPIHTQDKNWNWLWTAAAWSGALSLAALWLHSQPGLSLPFASSPKPSSSDLNYLSVIQKPGVQAPIASQTSAPETIAQPVFSNQLQSTVARSAPQVSATASINPLQHAQSLANKATTFSQNAQSIDDWRLVANQWQRAVATLAAVPTNSPDYTAAQQQLASYRPSWVVAQQKANQPIVEAPMPTTTVRISDGVTCHDRTTNAAAAIVELSEVRFTEGKTSIVGCITNHSDKSISNLLIGYRGTSSEQPSLFQAGQEQVSIATLEPGQTQIFRATLTLNSSISTVKIESVSWTIPGQTEPQIIATAIDLIRQ
ncbi:MAG: hypothetical protein Kow00121_49160 [Elainellaceae cyanobacterium]